jgi:two-component system sensor histidine kinase KdpD
MKRGNLRIYLGAAPGVGKTFAMLNEGWRRATRGTDVVIGIVETHGRKQTLDQIRDLEVIPRRTLEHRESVFEEMDVDAIIARRPRVVLVDELAHTNVPGSKHAKRYDDILEILDSGIDVISTVNIQHLESVNDVVEEITGVRQRETVPDEVVRSADQIELVDMSPEALRRRMAHGNIYPAEKVDTALGNYFREGNLSALRELALLWVADRVDDTLRDYRSLHGIDSQWETKERVCVAITGSPTTENLVRRAARLAQRSRAELVAVHVRTSDGLVSSESTELATVRQLVRDLGGEYHEVVGNEIGTALLQFARSENATQVVLGASRRSRWREITEGSVINSVIRDSRSIDVHVISDEGDENRRHRPRIRRRSTARLSPRRQVYAAMLAVVLLPVLTVVLAAIDTRLDLTADMLLFLLLVTVIAAIGGLWPALASALAASLLVNYYFTRRSTRSPSASSPTRSRSSSSSRWPRW